MADNKTPEDVQPGRMNAINPRDAAERAGGRSTSAEAPLARAITVEIYDQVYHLQGDDPEHVRRIASLVDGKMRAVAAHGKTVDSLRVAVLAALNVADELVLLQERYGALAGNLDAANDNIRSRAHSLAGLLDSVLETGT
ncbi:MAG TPA: cell division protein ZapA [Acidisarcina sp.]